MTGLTSFGQVVASVLHRWLPAPASALDDPVAETADRLERKRYWRQARTMALKPAVRA